MERWKAEESWRRVFFISSHLLFKLVQWKGREDICLSACLICKGNDPQVSGSTGRRRALLLGDSSPPIRCSHSPFLGFLLLCHSSFRIPTNFVLVLLGFYLRLFEITDSSLFAKALSWLIKQYIQHTILNVLMCYTPLRSEVSRKCYRESATFPNKYF